LNTANNKTTFKINLEGEFFSKNIQKHIAAKYKSTDVENLTMEKAALK
jgi:hypothetical protein